MEFSWWLIAIGVLLIAFHTTSHVVARLPASPAIAYFIVGAALGPWGFDLLRVDPAEQGVIMERACELAVLVSLFATGSTVGTTLRGRVWGVPVRLATVAMFITIALLAGFGYGVLGLSIGAAILLGAALAPTDPVLAGDVQVADASDRDRLRFGLTGEAGLNDGAAFPFVLLGLGLLSSHDLGSWGWRWWVVDVAWAVTGGVLIGGVLGIGAGRWVIRRWRLGAEDTGTDAFLGLGLVAVAYGIAVVLHAYGFLAVFAAAVALQWTVSGGETTKHAATPTPAADEAIAPLQRFNSDLESLCEFGVVLVLGALFAVVDVPLESLVVALLLFVVVRPAAVFIALRGTKLEREQRALAAWFGIRGIGSLYYIFFALNHGWQGAEASRVLGIVVGVVVASIFVHGISVTPLMGAYERHAKIARLAKRKKTPTRGRAPR